MRRIIHKLKITEISAVDKPAQAGAVMTIMKRDGESGLAAELSATNARFSKLLHEYKNPPAEIIPLAVYRAAAFRKEATPMDKDRSAGNRRVAKGSRKLRLQKLDAR